MKVPHFPVSDSCGVCHDPHASDTAHLLLEPAYQLCASCHDPADLKDSHSESLPDGAACGSCHAPHGSETAGMLIAGDLHRPFEDGDCKACHRPAFGPRIRLVSRGERLCTACHGDVDASVRNDAHVHDAMRGEKGRADCLACHDAHIGERMLLHDSGPGLCEDCHGPIVEHARADTGHFIAAEDCLACHRPHSSDQPALLISSQAELCAECHDTSDPDLAASHLGADPASLTCTGCHSPHGDGQPSLLASNMHAAIADGCDVCHDGAADRLIADSSTDLCLFCHDDVAETAAAAEVPHLALEVGDCTDCHNAHASPRPRLLLGNPGEECTACHDEQAAGPDEVAHGVIELVGCEACHEPHGGNREKLLREAGSELCLACHDSSLTTPRAGSETVQLLNRFAVPAAKLQSMAGLRLTPDGQHNHPVMDHRVLGRPTEKELSRTNSTFDGELTCLTCHDPHKGRSKELLQWGAASSMEACLHCHPK